MCFRSCRVRSGQPPFPVVVGGIQENSPAFGSSPLPDTKGRLGKDQETKLKQAKRIRRLAAGLTPGSATVLRWIIDKGEHQQAGKTTVTTAVARVPVARDSAKKQRATLPTRKALDKRADTLAI